MELIRTKADIVNVVLKQKAAISDLVTMLETLSDTYREEIEDEDLAEIEDLVAPYFDEIIEGDTIKSVLALQEWAAQ